MSGESGGVLPIDPANGGMTEQEIMADFKRKVAILAGETILKIRRLMREPETPINDEDDETPSDEEEDDSPIQHRKDEEKDGSM